MSMPFVLNRSSHYLHAREARGKAHAFFQVATINNKNGFHEPELPSFSSWHVRTRAVVFWVGSLLQLLPLRAAGNEGVWWKLGRALLLRSTDTLQPFIDHGFREPKAKPPHVFGCVAPLLSHVRLFLGRHRPLSSPRVRGARGVQGARPQACAFSRMVSINHGSVRGTPHGAPGRLLGGAAPPIFPTCGGGKRAPFFKCLHQLWISRAASSRRQYISR